MEEAIKLMIVDDHKIFRDGLKLLLGQFPFIGEIVEASDGQEFLNSLESGFPDIVLMDINMPVLGGIEATKVALNRYPELKIIVLTTFHDEDYVEQMMMAGVEGYMLKRSTPEEFEEALQKVKNGGNYFSDEIIRTVSRNLQRLRNEAGRISALPEFTQREREVLELICQGFNNDQIAEKIHISTKTVEKHKSNLFQKTNSGNTVNLIIYAFKNELVDLHSNENPD
jgi:DNA-binding NarL/FixJ family response regulator